MLVLDAARRGEDPARVRVARALVVLGQPVAEDHAASASLVELGLKLRQHRELGGCWQQRPAVRRETVTTKPTTVAALTVELIEPRGADVRDSLVAGAVRQHAVDELRSARAGERDADPPGDSLLVGPVDARLAAGVGAVLRTQQRLC